MRNISKVYQEMTEKQLLAYHTGPEERFKTAVREMIATKPEVFYMYSISA